MRFVEILTLATVATGLIWLLDSLFFKKNRIKDPWWVDYSKAFFPVLLIVLVIRSFVAEPFRIPSGSMRPTLVEGDFILVNKYNYGIRLPFTGTKLISMDTPQRGEVVVFKHSKNDESLDLIKRVVGVPGDHVEYKNKRIYINGEPVKLEFQGKKIDQEPNGLLSWPVNYHVETLGNINHDVYVHIEPNRHMDAFKDVVVPENSYFVMGDNRDNSGDSRAWGFVKDQDILGRAMLIWFSWNGSKTGLDCLKECIRWNRIGKHLGDTLKESPKTNIANSSKEDRHESKDSKAIKNIKNKEKQEPKVSKEKSN